MADKLEWFCEAPRAAIRNASWSSKPDEQETPRSESQWGAKRCRTDRHANVRHRSVPYRAGDLAIELQRLAGLGDGAGLGVASHEVLREVEMAARQRLLRRDRLVLRLQLLPQRLGACKRQASEAWACAARKCRIRSQGPLEGCKLAG